MFMVTYINTKFPYYVYLMHNLLILPMKIYLLDFVHKYYLLFS